MNCQEFESVSVEVARGQLLDAALRESARAHAAECAPCAERLRRERALTSALRVVGASMRELETPARVEAALLDALRERRTGRRAPEVAEHGVAPALTCPGASINSSAANPDAPVALVAPVASPLFAPRVRRAFYATALAASLILVAALAWRAASRDAATTARGQIANDTRGAEVNNGSAGDHVVGAGDHVVGDRVGGEVAAVTGPLKREAKSVVRRPSATRAGAGGGVLPISFREDGGRVTAEALSSAPVAGTNAAELASSSDFVSLGGAADAAPLDSGQMVRVEVPRAALAALGLPVNAARAGETVRADVLLAHDGTARAIRLLP